MPKLVFIDDNFSGRSYELVLEKTTIGRGDHNTLVIRDSSLSSSHCEILMHGAEIIVRDLDSRNGTFVGGHKLNKQAQAKSGQTIRFGSVEARLELDPSQGDSDTAEITAVYSLGKIMRDQRRAQNRPKPESASMQLDPEAHSAPEEQTILIPRSAASASPIAASHSPEPQGKFGSKSKLPLFLVLAVIGIFVVLWLIWGRK